MHFIKNILLIGLLFSLVVPVFSQEEINEFGYDNGFNNIVLALNRLESKQPKNANHAQEMYDGLGFAKSATLFKQSVDTENTDKAVWSNLANSAR